MAKAFRRKGSRYVAKLDAMERAMVTGLMEQVVELLDPPPPTTPADPSGTAEGDDFDAIVAGLGGLGVGVSVAGEDQEADATGPGERRNDAHEDPALGRLLPDANRQDPEAAAEFRRLTEGGLRSRKAENLRAAVAALQTGGEDRIELDQGAALAMVIALTDVRLVIGERLGLRTDEDADLIVEALEQADGDDPAVYAMAVYDFLTWLQEGLAHAMQP